MRTTINIDDALLREAQKITGEKNRGRVVDRALAELVRRDKTERLIALAGTIEIRDNWEEWEREELETEEKRRKERSKR
ncbi:MAG: type II toxin-antitoxin system VapB family antitoxin [Dehalococcoidia bacterium]